MDEENYENYDKKFVVLFCFP